MKPGRYRPALLDVLPVLDVPAVLAVLAMLAAVAGADDDSDRRERSAPGGIVRTSIVSPGRVGAGTLIRRSTGESDGARVLAAVRAAPVDSAVLRLPSLLPLVDSPDPDLRIRSRRALRRVVLGFLRSRAPPGMRLVEPRLEITSGGVRVLNGLYLAEHEVTVAEYRALASPGQRVPGHLSHAFADCPMTFVSLMEARAFAARLGARLPTCEELARAATAGGRRRFPWGDRFDPRRVNSREGGSGACEKVRARPGGCSADGIHGLLGNVAEWTESSLGEGERERYVVVGGSYRTPARTTRTITYRMRARERQSDVGFRLARSLPPLPPLPPLPARTSAATAPIAATGG